MIGKWLLVIGKWLLVIGKWLLNIYLAPFIKE
jgi:hypothetical protein